MVMEINILNSSNVGAVAQFMSTVKPEWWDYTGAYQQLQDISLLASLIGI